MRYDKIFLLLILLKRKTQSRGGGAMFGLNTMILHILDFTGSRPELGSEV